MRIAIGRLWFMLGPANPEFSSGIFIIVSANNSGVEVGAIPGEVFLYIAL
jgi:hypothetical protein